MAVWVFQQFLKQSMVCRVQSHSDGLIQFQMFQRLQDQVIDREHVPIDRCPCQPGRCCNRKFDRDFLHFTERLAMLSLQILQCFSRVSEQLLQAGDFFGFDATHADLFCCHHVMDGI